MDKKIFNISNIVKASLTTLAVGIANIAGAQTASTTTPGVPTTGLSGFSTGNILLVLLAAALVFIGLASLLTSENYSL